MYRIGQVFPWGQAFPSLSLAAQDEKSGTQLFYHFPPKEKETMLKGRA